MKNIRKQLLHSAIPAIVAVFGVLAPVAHASTVTGNFNVTVNLTSACEITAGPSDVAFTYTSFQTGDATSTGGAFSVRCTNTLPYTLSLDSTTGTVIGLNYSLSLSASSGTGAGLSAANYTVSGTMHSGQSGNCATSPTVGTCAGSQARVLTITY